MISVLLFIVSLVGTLCFLAYNLAIYSLPLVFGLAASRLAYETGSGMIGTGVVALVVGAIAFGLLSSVYTTHRSASLRLFACLIFAAPAAVAGYALVLGLTREAVPSELWRQIFCIAGGAFVGVSALSRLARLTEAQA
jgi:hypothetical protein